MRIPPLAALGFILVMVAAAFLGFTGYICAKIPAYCPWPSACERNHSCPYIPPAATGI